MKTDNAKTVKVKWLGCGVFIPTIGCVSRGKIYDCTTNELAQFIKEGIGEAVKASTPAKAKEKVSVPDAIEPDAAKPRTGPTLMTDKEG